MPPLDDYLSAMPDRVVTRVNELTTTFLDVLGMLLFTAAAGVAGYTMVGLWLGLFAGAVTVTVLSAFAQWRSRPRPIPDEAEPIEPQPLPGAEHPGNLHVLGR